MNWENSVTIHRPVEQVFAFLTDPKGGSEWHRANQISPISDGAIGVGSKFRVSGKFLIWKFDSISEVTEYEHNRKVTYRSDAGMYTYELRYRLAPEDGGTLLTESGSADPRGLLKFAVRIFLGGAEKNSNRGLLLLKNILEGE